MVSPELIRRFPFFSGLTMDHLVILAMTAEEVAVPKDHYFIQEGDEVKHLYIILEGEVVIVTTLPQKDREIIVNTLGTGDLFGWSALVPPYAATAGVKAMTTSRVIAFDAEQLHQKFEEDCKFGYLMMLKTAQVIRDRLNALRIETLAYSAG